MFKLNLTEEWYAEALKIEDAAGDFTVVPEVSKVRLIGYWKGTEDSKEPYPWPGDLVDPEYWVQNPGVKEKVVEYLGAGRKCNFYRGFSSCRICEVLLGTCERTDGLWCWPDKLEHYVEEHDVRLPLHFIHTVLFEPVSPRDLSEREYFHPDETFWTNWRRYDA